MAKESELLEEIIDELRGQGDDLAKIDQSTDATVDNLIDIKVDIEAMLGRLDNVLIPRFDAMANAMIDLRNVMLGLSMETEEYHKMEAFREKKADRAAAVNNSFLKTLNDLPAKIGKSLSTVTPDDSGNQGGNSFLKGVFEKAGLGKVAKGLGSGLKDAAMGIAMLGLAVPAFFAGASIGSTILEAGESAGIFDFDFAGLKKAAKGFSGIITELDSDAMIAIGGLLAVAGWAGKENGLGAAKSIAMMGLSVTAFLGGLAVGNTVLAFGDATGFLDMDFNAMKDVMRGFSGMIMELDENAMIVMGSLIGIAGFTGAKKGLGAAKSIALMGISITAFLTGLAAGELAIGGMAGAGLDLDFPAMKNMFSGFSNAIESLSPSAMTAFGVLIASAAAITGMKVSSVKLATMMTMIGAGIIGFLSGFGIGELAAGAAGSAGLDLDFPALQEVFQGFNNVVSKIDAGALALLGIAGLAAVSLASLPFASGAKFTTSMIFIGAGITGFLAGFSVGELAVGAMGSIVDLNFPALQAAMIGFNLVIDEVSSSSLAILGVAAATAAVLSTGSFSSAAKFATGMTFIGAGIGGFLLGLGIGELAVGAAGTIVDLNFPAMREAFIGFDSLLGELSDTTLVAMAGLMAGGGILAMIGGFGGAAAFAAAMTGIGAGIGGFLIGFEGVVALGGVIGLDGSAIADLMTNIAEGAKSFEGIDMVNLSAGLALLGPAILALMGSDGLAGIGEGAKKAVGWFTGLFKSDEAKKAAEEDRKSGIFGKLARMLGDPSQLDVQAINEVMDALDEGKASRFSASIHSIADALGDFANDKGFWAGIGDAMVNMFGGNKDPLEPFIKIADKGDDLARAGAGIQRVKLALEGGLGSNVDKNGLHEVVRFARDLGKEQTKLDKASIALRSIASSVVKITNSEPSVALVGLGSEAERASQELTNYQAVMQDNQAAAQSAQVNNVVAPTTVANSSTTNVTNNVASGTPSTRDNSDNLYIFRATGNSR